MITQLLKNNHRQLKKTKKPEALKEMKRNWSLLLMVGLNFMI